MIIKDSLLVVPSDWHTGGSTALFPSKGFKNIEGNVVSPNDRQREIHTVFTKLSAEVKLARKNRRLIIVFLGDAIDGFHHGSLQESLFHVKDQCDAHVTMMSDFMRRTGYSRKGGDQLHYVKGTESHVGDNEMGIAKELGAVKNAQGNHISDILTLNINGSTHMFVHHGKNRGSGQNEGNALRNFLRDFRNEREKEGLPYPDVLWSGHTHGHTWNSHIVRRPEGQFHELHGVICPSFQAKTRYAYKVVPSAVNSVGGVFAKIAASGEMSPPRFVVKATTDV